MVALSPPAAETARRRRRVVVLGSTGSIGTNCLDVVASLEDRLQPLGLSAHSNWETLFEQARRWRPRWVTVTDPQAPCTGTRLHGECLLLHGEDGIRTMVS